MSGAAGIAVVSTRGGFDALERDWRALEKIAAGAVLFQSFDWCRAVFDHHAANNQSFQPLILTLRDGSGRDGSGRDGSGRDGSGREGARLVGLLPLQRLQSGLARIATGFAEPYQQYTDMLLSPDAPADAATRLLDAACRAEGCEGLHLLKVRDDSALAPPLAARGAMRSNADAAPFVDLRPFPDFGAYHRMVNAKTRKNMRNARNRLARSGALAHRVHDGASEIDALVRRAHAGREQWLEEQGLTSRAFRDASFGAFARAAAQPASGLCALAMSLTLDGAPIAEQWGFILNGRYYAYVATWAPEFEESSPGKLHLEEVIRCCHERGIGVADFLMPAARYKFTWTDQAMPVADYALPLSLAARLQFSLWSGFIRPQLKRLALMLPAGLRSRITRVLLRRSWGKQAV